MLKIFTQRPVCVESGYAAIWMVVIISSIVMAGAVQFVGQSRREIVAARVFYQSAQARANANRCAEEALQQIRSATGYTGTGNVAISGGGCDYAVSSQGGEARTVAVTATQDQARRQINISISQINPKLIVSAWQEM